MSSLYILQYLQLVLYHLRLPLLGSLLFIL